MSRVYEYVISEIYVNLSLHMNNFNFKLVWILANLHSMESIFGQVIFGRVIDYSCGLLAASILKMCWPFSIVIIDRHEIIFFS